MQRLIDELEMNSVPSVYIPTSCAHDVILTILDLASVSLSVHDLCNHNSVHALL